MITVSQLTKEQRAALHDLLNEVRDGHVEPLWTLINRVAEKGPHVKRDVVIAARAWRQPLNWD